MRFSRSSHRPPAHPARPARWAVLLAASILLHLMALRFAGLHLALPALPADKPTVVTAVLTHPSPKAAPTPPPASPRPPRKKNATPVPKPAPVPQQTPERETTAVEPLADTVASVAEAEPPDTPAPEPEPSPVATEEPAPGSPYAIDLPPSAQLEFDVRALRNGQNWYGRGHFTWENTGDRYTITGEAGISLIFSITVLNFKSEGMVNDAGIAPVLYSEKPWRKSLTNTHFQHENKLISFSASTRTYPYSGGEQDRASIIWQLAGIGRGTPEQFTTGTAFDIFVAGTRRAEVWRLIVIGEEEVNTPYGTLRAWRVERTPRPGSYDEKIEIWFAPELGWYPVRLLYTYASGDYLDLSLKKLNH